MFGVAGATDNILEHDAIAAQVLHPTRSFVDDVHDTIDHSVGTPAVGHHFRIERQSSIAIALVERIENFPVRLDSDDFSRLELQRSGRGFAAPRDSTHPPGKGRSLSEALHAIVDPA